MKQRLCYISGLPRTGSTLLSNILMQNPSVYSGGRSALCQMMWDMQCSINGPAEDALKASRRLEQTSKDIMTELPALYYKSVSKDIVFDKCRTWTLYENHQMIKRYIDKNPKVVVLIRPVDEIVRSFAKLRLDNGWVGDVYTDLLLPNTDPLTLPLEGIKYAKYIRDEGFLFVTYKSLVENPSMVLEQIYKHCEIDPFAHDFDTIKQVFVEDDDVYGLVGMHDVRQEIKFRANNIGLPQNIQQISDEMTNALYDGLRAI